MSHSILDVPYLAVGAVLAIAGVPSIRTILLGLVSAFAGLTAIFALNDMIDYRVDAQKMKVVSGKSASFDLDSLGFRHPVAQGKLSVGAGLAWVVFWGALSFLTAWLVRPACAWLLVTAGGLEAAYCGLLRVTPWKTVLSGCNVAVGGLAGLYAVTSTPLPRLALLYFFWALTWEMGCRNIPNDWIDFSEDTTLGIKTLPVRFGLLRAARISFATMILTALCAVFFPFVSPLADWPLYELGAFGAATFLLVLPSLEWQRNLSRTSALAFFNSACFYPLAMFAALALAVAL
jgi:4-hydroxybenzoate polyprenyltransferase